MIISKYIMKNTPEYSWQPEGSFAGATKTKTYMMTSSNGNILRVTTGYWPFVWGIHRSPVNSPHKGQWRGALMFSLICSRINGWVNNREVSDLRRHRAHYDWFFYYSDSMIHSTWYNSQHKVPLQGLLVTINMFSGHIRMGKLYISISWQLTLSQKNIMTSF